MRKFNLSPSARHITEANFRGSNEKIVGRDGHINGGSVQEVAARILEIASMINSGDLFTDVSHSVTPDTAVNARAELAAAYHDAEAWAELGTAITSEIQGRVLRDGFMRVLFDRGEVQEGATPRIRVRTPNVRAIVSKGVGMHHPQYVRDRYMPVDEFTIAANVRVEELEMHQGSGNILEDKFYEAQEQILVKEDKVAVGLLRAATGVYNPATYFSGAFTPVIMQGMREDLTAWSLPVSTFLFSIDLGSDMLVGSAFSDWYDPITKYDHIQSGRIGQLMGMNLITDGFREPNLQVLEQGEAFMTTTPGMLGGYTDRGPIMSRPVDSYPDGVAARGWYMNEHLSCALANAKGVVTASR